MKSRKSPPMILSAEDASRSLLTDQVAALRKRVDALGPTDPKFDTKAFSDWLERDE